jgi:hypothetical protein
MPIQAGYSKLDLVTLAVLEVSVEKRIPMRAPAEEAHALARRWIIGCPCGRGWNLTDLGRRELDLYLKLNTP